MALLSSSAMGDFRLQPACCSTRCALRTADSDDQYVDSFFRPSSAALSARAVRAPVRVLLQSDFCRRRAGRAEAYLETVFAPAFRVARARADPLRDGTIALRRQHALPERAFPTSLVPNRDTRRQVPRRHRGRRRELSGRFLERRGGRRQRGRRYERRKDVSAAGGPAVPAQDPNALGCWAWGSPRHGGGRGAPHIRTQIFLQPYFSYGRAPVRQSPMDSPPSFGPKSCTIHNSSPVGVSTCAPRLRFGEGRSRAGAPTRPGRWRRPGVTGEPRRKAAAACDRAPTSISAPGTGSGTAPPAPVARP